MSTSLAVVIRHSSPYPPYVVSALVHGVYCGSLVRVLVSVGMVAIADSIKLLSASIPLSLCVFTDTCSSTVVTVVQILVSSVVIFGVVAIGTV